MGSFSFFSPTKKTETGFRPLPRRPSDQRPLVADLAKQGGETPTEVWERRKRTGVKLVGGILCMGLLVFALMPREPQWEVLDLKFKQVSIPAFEGLSDIMEGETAIHMTMETTVRASNPNVIGAHALPGIFAVVYKNHTIGHARTHPLSIGPMSSILLNVTAGVNHIPGNMGMEMLNEMRDHNMQLPIQVTGEVIAEVGPLKVRTTIRCDLRTDCSELPQRTKFTYKKCTYIYDLPDEASLAQAAELAKEEALEKAKATN